MRRIDVHIHSGLGTDSGRFDGAALLARLAEADFDGGVVFSNRPVGMLGGIADGHERLDGLLESCAPYAGKLFPVFWIHPDEPGVNDLIAEASERGVVGYKCICTNFYVYEDKSLRMMEEVAKTGKPIMFHSGILWDDTPSSKYNRPVHWEDLCTIPNLRFSLAHCSWPWYDECLALYGKFLTNHMKHPELNNEMFFDMTPGTPVPYRRDLYTKLLTCGYDTKHNMIWGTDCHAENYNPKWTRQWYTLDNQIMDELGEPEETRELLFQKNMERFFRLTDETYTPRPLTGDGT